MRIRTAAISGFLISAVALGAAAVSSPTAQPVLAAKPQPSPTSPAPKPPPPTITVVPVVTQQIEPNSYTVTGTYSCSSFPLTPDGQIAVTVTQTDPITGTPVAAEGGVNVDCDGTEHTYTVTIFGTLFPGDALVKASIKDLWGQNATTGFVPATVVGLP